MFFLDGSLAFDAFADSVPRQKAKDGFSQNMQIGSKTDGVKIPKIEGELFFVR